MIISASEAIRNQVQTNRNLYMLAGKHFRLFAKGTTPNGHWLIGPEFRELRDICAATGNDVYGDEVVPVDEFCGSFPAGRDFIHC